MGADLKPGSLFWLASKEASHFFWGEPTIGLAGTQARGFRPKIAPT